MAEPGGTLLYRVSELTDVSDRAIEEALNRESREGFRFESVHFVTQPGNRRPTMAFLFFTRARDRRRHDGRGRRPAKTGSSSSTRAARATWRG